MLAEEKGEVDSDGVPFTTVVVDGGWSKRSYGHNYSASSGVVNILTFIMYLFYVKNQDIYVLSNTRTNEYACFISDYHE